MIRFTTNNKSDPLKHSPRKVTIGMKNMRFGVQKLSLIALAPMSAFSLTIVGRKARLLTFLAFLLTALPTLRSERVDNRDFKIDTYYPTTNEIQLAEARAGRFWAKHASRYGPEPKYLAVETSKIFPSEVQDLWPKLINSQTTASFFSHGKKTYSNLELSGTMIYDTKTGRFVSNQGYISVDTPPRGRVARFGLYIARYIGTGR